MANTTISIRSSGDTGVTPSLGVLANGELALNFADGILYYKTASNTLGTITTTEPAGLNKEIQFNDSGSFGSNAGLTFDKTTGTFTVPSLNVASVYSLPTTDGTNGQLLTTDGSGTITFQDAPTPPANVSISTFSGIGDGSTTEYNIGFRPLSREALLITIGGVLQDPDTAYTIDQDNNTVTFTSAPSNTAPISVVSLYTNVTPIGPANVIVSNFITTANGVVDTFDLGFNPVSANNLTVAVDGVLQTPTVHYTVNTTANTITFDSIPPNSANISVVSLYTNVNTYVDVIGSAAFAHANGAFDAANGASTLAQNAYDYANTIISDTQVDPYARAHANGAFDTANTNATTDFTNVSITAGDYGSAVIIPVVHLEANGRVSSVTNTSITSGTTSDAGIVQLTDATNSTSTTTAATPNSVKSAYDLADTANTNAATAQSTADGAQTHAEGAFTQANTNSTTDYTAVSITAGDYGSEVIIPVVHLEANGRVSAVANTSVRAGSTSVTGIVQLTDATNSTSTTTAATPNAVKSAYDLADTANTNAATAQSTADGAQTHAEGAFTQANTNASNITTAQNTADGAQTHAEGAFTQANTNASSITTTNSRLDSAFGHANGAFDAANTKFASAGGTISGDTTITGNLTVVGETVYANTTTALIADNILTVNAAIDQASAPASNAGLEVDRGSSANVSLLWNETDDKWTFTNDGSNYSPIADADRLDSAFGAANTAQSTADGAQTHAEGAFTQANTNASDITTTNGRLDSAYTQANTATSDASAAQTHAEGAFTQANTNATNITTAQAHADGSFDHANGAFSAANTASTSDYTNVSVTPGTYGNSTAIPSVTVEANGRISSVTTQAFSAATVGDILALSIALG